MSDRRTLLVNYIAWLDMERRLAAVELHRLERPDASERELLTASRAVPVAEVSPQVADFHGHGDWRDKPSPSTRAVAVLRAVGLTFGNEVANG
ncbi:hypothetical protein V5F44_18200 [Xanthobacter sp. V2C-8]|uniref:hypothetical protein n=1 Tax=Xanthobacter albus TaxID=3119929 RepID=UPI0037280769